MSRLGLMGGTFDPVHHGHLVAAEEARVALELDRVLFVPAGQPWQKDDRTVTPPQDRYEMTVRAVQDNEHFEVSRVDLDRDGPTYTVDTLRSIAAIEPGAELFFITGADAILQILTWKDPEEALALATFVAVSRPGHDLAALDALAVARDVVRLEIPALAISSSDIRRRVAEGRPIRYLLPEAVRDYVDRHRLYCA